MVRVSASRLCSGLSRSSILRDSGSVAAPSSCYQLEGDIGTPGLDALAWGEKAAAHV